VDTPTAKNVGEAESSVAQDQFQLENEAQSPLPMVPSAWQIGLVIVAVTGLLLMFLMRQLAMSRWRQK
jgi:hypothetical protein